MSLRIGDQVKYRATAYKGRRNAQSWRLENGKRKFLVETKWQRRESDSPSLGVFLGWARVANGAFIDEEGERILLSSFNSSEIVRCAVVQPSPDSGTRYRRHVYVFPDDLEKVQRD